MWLGFIFSGVTVLILLSTDISHINSEAGWLPALIPHSHCTVTQSLFAVLKFSLCIAQTLLWNVFFLLLIVNVCNLSYGHAAAYSLIGHPVAYNSWWFAPWDPLIFCFHFSEPFWNSTNLFCLLCWLHFLNLYISNRCSGLIPWLLIQSPWATFPL